MRHEYETIGLDEAHVAEDPFSQFDRWFGEAVDAGLHEPNAMVVSTVDSDGVPWGRHLLLKGVTADAEGVKGFEFYTNYTSQKGEQLAGNPAAALTFPWLGLHRQVCVSGMASRLSTSESDAYFAVRPRGSQLGAWASDQSTDISDRSILEARLAEVEARYPHDVPRPPHWGGYRVRPNVVEFWQGRPNRLHDRLRFARDGSDTHWTLSRLSP